MNLILSQISLSLLMTIDFSSSTPPDPQCPLWTSPQNGSCKCGNDLRGIVKCEDGRGAYALTYCFCMTMQDDQNTPVVGSCYYTYHLARNASNYNKIGSGNGTLNDMTCGPFNRNGTMCGRCIEGYGLPVYSYNLSCVECTDYKYNWLKYIAVAYGPLTVFYFIIIIFRISATSGYMLGYVTVCQMLTIRGLATMLFNFTTGSFTHNIFTKYALALVSIWNLDFFRSLYPPFCLHPHISSLQIMVLDYAVAVYLMVLIFITYLFVKVHDRFRLVVWLCRPAYMCFHHFRKEWEIRNSLIGAFATFYLLSYVKILDVSGSILSPIQFYDINGTIGKFFYYHNATVPYFGKEHAPYALLAIIICLVFNILPLVLLCLYPCPCFQRCLNKLRYRWHTLHTFMDAILGSYKHRPQERRFFGATYLLLRICNIAAFNVETPLVYVSAASYIWMLAITLAAIFQPHKNKFHNIIDVILFFSVLQCYLVMIFYLEKMFVDSIYSYNIQFMLYCIVVYVFLFVIFLYGLILIAHKIVPFKFTKKIFSILYSKLTILKREDIEEESLPYRLEQEDEKNPLLTDMAPRHYYV